MGKEMVKLSWATKTFVPLQFYNLVSLLLQCLISLFARSLDCLFVFFLFVLFFFLPQVLIDRLVDRPTDLHTSLPVFLLPFSFLICQLLLFFLGHARPYLPTNIFILLLKSSLHPCARSSLLLHAISTFIFSSISIRTAVYPSTIYCLAQFPASWLLCMPDISEDLLPTCLQRLGAWKKNRQILQQILHFSAELCDLDVFGNKPVPPRVTRIHP